MGPTPRRELKCNICKSTFPSFKDKSNAKLSHRSHRNTNKSCLAAQERLRRQHQASGNDDEINFDYIDDEDENEIVSIDGDSAEVFEVDFFEGNEAGEIDDEDDNNDEDGEEEEDEHDKEEDEDEEVENEDSIANSEDSYSKDRLAEDREYAEHSAKEETMDLEQRVVFDFERAEEKKDPRERSYWANPQTELIGVHVKKLFGIHGWFEGVVESYERPYYRIVYSDDDYEQLNLNEVLELIDLDYFSDYRNGERDAMAAHLEDDEETDGVFQGDEVRGIGGVDVDGDADSKSSNSSDNNQWTVKSFNREDCDENDVLKVQELVLSRLYDQQSTLIRFNKVNNGKIVDKIAALHLLVIIVSNFDKAFLYTSLIFVLLL
jgi:hypothetical protein